MVWVSTGWRFIGFASLPDRKTFTWVAGPRFSFGIPKATNLQRHKAISLL